MPRSDHRLLRRGLILGAVLLAAACARKVDAPPVSVVFFNAFSADLDGPAQGIIAEFARDAKTVPSRPVIVAGYADKQGSPGANQLLSALRARVVADALTANGVAAGRIQQRPRGATDSDPGVESRRVEMTLGSVQQ